MVVAFLQGKQSPTVEFFGLDADPNRMTATWRVYFEFVAALADHRAGARPLVGSEHIGRRAGRSDFPLGRYGPTGPGGCTSTAGYRAGVANRPCGRAALVFLLTIQAQRPGGTTPLDRRKDK